MKINEIKNIRIQTLASYDDISKMFKYAVCAIDDNVEVIAKEIKTANEYDHNKIRHIYTLGLDGYLISDDLDTLPNAKKIKISYQVLSEFDDDDEGNIDINKIYSVKIDDLPKDVKNHFHKQLKEIQLSFNKNMVNIKNDDLPVVCGKCEYDYYKDDVIYTYNIVSVNK